MHLWAVTTSDYNSWDIAAFLNLSTIENYNLTAGHFMINLVFSLSEIAKK